MATSIQRVQSRQIAEQVHDHLIDVIQRLLKSSPTTSQFHAARIAAETCTADQLRRVASFHLLLFGSGNRRKYELVEEVAAFFGRVPLEKGNGDYYSNNPVRLLG